MAGGVIEYELTKSMKPDAQEKLWHILYVDVRLMVFQFKMLLFECFVLRINLFAVLDAFLCACKICSKMIFLFNLVDNSLLLLNLSQKMFLKIFVYKCIPLNCLPLM